MRVTETQIVRALTELENAGTIGTIELSQSVIGFLKKKRLLGSYRKIISALEREIEQQEGQLRVTVHSARSLEPSEEKMIEQRAAELFPQLKLKLEYRILPDLIGGIRLETADVRYDATLARSLRLLAQSL